MLLHDQCGLVSLERERGLTKFHSWGLLGQGAGEGQCALWKGTLFPAAWCVHTGKSVKDRKAVVWKSSGAEG